MWFSSFKNRTKNSISSSKVEKYVVVPFKFWIIFKFLSRPESFRYRSFRSLKKPSDRTLGVFTWSVPIRTNRKCTNCSARIRGRSVSGSTRSGRPWRGATFYTSATRFNVNSSASERAFPSKLVPFELGQDNLSVSKPISINQGDVTRSENIQASWNTPSPAQPPNLSPQHGPINGILPRRDSESSGKYLFSR